MSRDVYISVDPGEVRLAICVGEKLPGGSFKTLYVGCANIREANATNHIDTAPSPKQSKNKKKKKNTAHWDGAAIAKELDDAIVAAGIDGLASSTTCLFENQHMSSDRGHEVSGAIKMFAQMRGMRGVVKVHAADRGRFFGFEKYLDDGVLSAKMAAYRYRKTQAVSAVRDRIDRHPELFSSQSLERLRTATERSGKFDMADAVTLAIAHVESLAARQAPEQGRRLAKKKKVVIVISDSDSYSTRN